MPFLEAIRTRRYGCSGLIGAVAIGMLGGCDDGSRIVTFPGDAAAPAYAVLTRVNAGPDSVTGLLYVVDSIASPEHADPASAYELGGGGTLAPVQGERAVLFFSNEQPTVTRYDIDELGVPTEGTTLSAAATGAQSLSFLAQVTPDVVWLQAFPSLALLPLNLATEELGAVVNLSSLYRAGLPDAYFGAAVVRDGKLFVPVFHTNFTEGTAAPGTEVVVFDPATGAYDVLRDERCDWGAPAIVGGELLLAASSIFGAALQIQGAAGFGDPCVLRIPAGSRAIDPEWTVPFSTWTEGAAAGELIPVADDRAYIRVYDATLPPSDPLYYWDYAYTDAWRWGVVDPKLDRASRFLDGPPTFGRVDRYDVDGKPWIFEYTDADDTSQFASLGLTGIVSGMAFTGFIDGVVGLASPAR